jgi:hypothetical protein
MTRPGPWFKFYPNDYINDKKISQLPYGPKGMLLELWSLCWIHDGLPKELHEIAELLNMKEDTFKKYWEYLGEFFVLDNDKYQSARMEKEVMLTARFEPIAIRIEATPNDENYMEYLDIWNRYAEEGGLPKAEELNIRRKVALKARIRDGRFKELFVEALKFMITKPFYRGKNESNWKPTLDYLLRPGKALSLAEQSKTKGGRDAADRHFLSELKDLGGQNNDPGDGDDCMSGLPWECDGGLVPVMRQMP